MQTVRAIVMLSAASLAALAVPIVGCEKKAAPTKPAAGTPAPADHGHDHGPGDGHGHSHGGEVVALGEQTIGGFQAKATRDGGPVVAGKDAGIDVTVTPTGAGKVRAVRFWIGGQDAKGSVKAKAEIEDPKEPNRWHTHAEVPNPLPTGSKLWVEIEDEAGATSVGSFDLKM